MPIIDKSKKKATIEPKNAPKPDPGKVAKDALDAQKVSCGVPRTYVVKSMTREDQGVLPDDTIDGVVDESEAIRIYCIKHKVLSKARRFRVNEVKGKAAQAPQAATA